MNTLDFKEYMRKGGIELLNIAQEAWKKNMDEKEKEAYSQGIYKGIENTIAILLEEKIDEIRIVELLNKHWEVDADQAIMLIQSKKIADTVTLVKQHLKLKGYTDEKISEFVKNNGVRAKIRNSPKLLELKQNPQKLINELKK